MTITVEIPEELAGHLIAARKDPARARPLKQWLWKDIGATA